MHSTAEHRGQPQHALRIGAGGHDDAPQMLTGQAVIGWIFLAQRSDAVGIIEHQRTDARAMRGEHGFAGGPPVGTVCGTVREPSGTVGNRGQAIIGSCQYGPRSTALMQYWTQCDRCMSTLRLHASTCPPEYVALVL